MRYHYVIMRMAKKITDNLKCWWGCRTRETIMLCQWEGKMEQMLRNRLSVFHNVKCSWTIWPRYSTRGYLPKKIGNLCSCKNLYISVFDSFICNGWKMGKTQESSNRWMDKLCYIHTMDYYSARKRNDLLIYATCWIDLMAIMLSKISQPWRLHTTWFYLLFIILEVTKYGDGELPSGFQQLGLREECNYKRETHGIFFVVMEQFGA